MTYVLKRSTRARTMRIAVHPDGGVVVTAPKFFGLDAIERFVLKHSEWIRKHVEKTHDRTVIRIQKSDIPALKRQALDFATERSAYYARVYGLPYKKISIRAQKTRWGSCSKVGNLSFNYKIAVLPREIAEYIVVHEICHLGAFDHSKKFWNLVARTVPNHKAIRKALKNIVFVYV